MVELIVLGIALLPGFAWLFFFLQEEDHEEPKRLVLFTFLLGIAAALVAFGVQYYGLQPLLFGEHDAAISIIALLILAATEEIAKFGAAYLAVHDNPAFTEPIDAMIYMVIAALGFATLENFGAIYDTVTRALPVTTQSALIIGLQTASLRFVGATLLHTLSSAIVGYYWAWSIREFNRTRILLGGLVAGTVLHAFFNYLIIKNDNLSYALAFVIIVGFFVLNDFESFREKKL
ncbi:MAG TPA: PrsW family intramembrane metalloprotease [Candidatus Paceibacterota bacterium]|nr:PrsW family intramembrane metalloprotease [Candidatus Paceibacterota bacterium]